MGQNHAKEANSRDQESLVGDTAASKSKNRDNEATAASEDSSDDRSACTHVGDYMPHPNALQLRFLDYVVGGKVAELRSFVQKHKLTGALYADCRNYRGQTALELAVSCSDIDMVSYLIQLGVTDKALNCALVRAAQLGNINLVKTLLDAEAIDETHYLRHDSECEFNSNVEKFCRNMKDEVERAERQDCCADFTCDVTPLMMASQCNHYEVVKLLLSRGQTVHRPHPAVCPCSQCRRRSTKQKHFTLSETTSRLNAYRALTSASFISQSSEDPILTAFELNAELRDWARYEPEFKDDYLKLADTAGKFAVSIIGLCQTTYEVKQVLNKRTGRMHYYEHGAQVEPFHRVALAIRFEQTEFVTHSNCQEVMRAEWQRHWEGFTATSWTSVLSAFFIRLFLLPLVAIFYRVAPRTKLARSFHSPLTKYISSLAVYVVFLVLLLAQNLIDARTGNRGPPRTGLELFIVLFVFGNWWKCLQNLWFHGSEMFSRHGWNLFDNIMLIFFSLTFICWGMSAYDVARYGKADLTRNLWSSYDPRLVGEAFYSVACILAILKLMFFTQITSYFGPLQVSINRMMVDLSTFLFLMLMFIVAFAMGLWIIYRGYSGFQRHNADGSTMQQPRAYDDLLLSMSTLYWAHYGLKEVANHDVVIPEFTVSIGNDTLTIYNSHRMTELFGYTLYAFASFCCIVILLNMLVAVLTNTLSAIQAQADVEWKYARTKIWLSFFLDDDVLPSPFNLIPDFYSFVWWFRWCQRRFFSRSRHHGPQARCDWNKCCYMEDSGCSEKQQAVAYQQVMARLIQRYFAAQSTESFPKKNTSDDAAGQKGTSDDSQMKTLLSTVEEIKLNLDSLTKAIQLLQTSVLSIKKTI